MDLTNPLSFLFDIGFDNSVFDAINDGSFDISSPSATLRRKVNDILLNTTLSNFTKLEEIILLSIEYHPHTEYLPPFETLYSVVESQSLSLTVEEIKSIRELLHLRYLINKDLISRRGVKELYPQYSNRILKSRLKFDPINIYKRGKDILHLFSMVETSDVVKLKSKIKPLSLRQLFNKAKRLTYPEFTYWCDVYRLFHGNKDDAKIFEFERNHKFKLTPKSIYLLKTIRRKKILGEPISYFDLSSLERELGSFNFYRVPKIIWKGLSKEIKLALLSHPSYISSKKIDVILNKYYPRHKNLILNIISKYIPWQKQTHTAL